MLFALNNGLLDVSIAVWEAKRTDDAIRPQTARRFFYKGQTIQGWVGRGKDSLRRSRLSVQNDWASGRGRGVGALPTVAQGRDAVEPS
jgi:hypothetical protein